MGIAGLARRLEPQATQYSAQGLIGFNAIIDGPPLAYHAHKLALAAVGNVSRIPSYADITLQALRWLKTLESAHIKVAAILFDGVLPETKQHERLIRTERNNQQVKQLRSKHSTAACPIPTHLGSVSYSFLAPALKEALDTSEYASTTRIVPGEADDWCAPYANQYARSIIFSNDTDLLLYNYSQDVRVLFLRDVELWPEPKFRGYSPSGICHNLGLPSLVPFAYCLTQDPWKTEKTLAEEAKRVDIDSELYRQFSKRYIPSTATTSSEHLSIVPPLQHLDVRISEYVHQCLGAVPIPVVYLPLLVEDQHQSSAWNVGQELRTLAYSLLASTQSRAQEYRRKAQTVAVHDVHLYPSHELTTTLQGLVHSTSVWLHWRADRHVPPDLTWPLFALGLVLPKLKSPPRIALLLRILSADFDNTWDFVHLTACLQAALYSLRFLKQCLGVWLAVRAESAPLLSVGAKYLFGVLQSMGSIVELFIVPGQARKALGDEEGVREILAEVYASAGLEVLVEQKGNKKAKKQKREAERKNRRSQETGAQLSGNAFEVLKQE